MLLSTCTGSRVGWQVFFAKSGFGFNIYNKTVLFYFRAEEVFSLSICTSMCSMVD